MGFLDDRTNRIAVKSTYRNLKQYEGSIDFFSNDYLGIAQSSHVVNGLRNYFANEQARLGATGSRLISGNNKAHEVLEEELAEFYGSEAALLFPSGYQANVGVIASLCQRNDMILFDEKVHASTRDGIRLSMARSFGFAHNNLEELESQLIKYNAIEGQVFVLIESLYSMDGDFAELQQVVELARRFGAHIVLDEAHSVGVLGEGGRGLAQLHCVEDEVLLRLITFGKAYGQSGAAVLGSNALKAYLVNACRSFIYTTGIPGYQVEAIRLAHQVLAQANRERMALGEIIDYFRSKKLELNLLGMSNPGPIQSIRVKDSEQLQLLADKINQEGINVKAIFPPTVQKGEECIRICLHAFNTKEEVDRLFAVSC